MALLDIPDAAYNWLVDFFVGHGHCTRYAGTTFTVLDISASIIQGSATGPASYVVNAADLTTVTNGNAIFKYGDDTYIVIPARNIQSRGNELDNVSKWALANNLRLNKAKCVEIVFTDRRRKFQICQPPTIPDIQRVTSVSILGVTISNRLSVSEHVHRASLVSASSLCRRLKSSEVTAWAMMHLRLSTSRLCSLSYSMLPLMVGFRHFGW